MQEDMEALKKGEVPAGFKIEKESEKAEKAPEIMPGPKVTPPPPLKSTQAELGGLERAKPLPGMTTSPLAKPSIPVPPAPAPVLGKPGISVPSAEGILAGSKKFLIPAAAVILIAVGFSVWFFVFRQAAPEITFTPTPTPTPTPLIIPIDQLFNIPTVVIAGGNNFFSRLESQNKTLLIPGESAVYRVIDPATSQSYSFGNFMSAASITVPPEIFTYLNDPVFYVSLMQKGDGNLSRGFLVKLNETPGIRGAVSLWENDIPASMQEIFNLDLKKASSLGFLDNFYQNVPVRYINYPDHLKTVDYSVILTSGGESYLVFTNSREHIYDIIDRIR